MFAACSTSPEGTARPDVQSTSAPSGVTAEATGPAAENNPTPTSENREPDNTYHNYGVGFSITKPSDWLYTDPQLVKAQVDKARLDDKDLEALVKNGKTPLVVITRYPLSTPKLNPNVIVKLTAVESDNFPLRVLMNFSLQIIKRSSPDLTLVDEIQDTEVDGIAGVYSKFTYTLSPMARNQPILARMWLLSRGKVIFGIIMTGPQEGPDVSEEAFEEILNSIKIAR